VTITQSTTSSQSSGGGGPLDWLWGGIVWFFSSIWNALNGYLFTPVYFLIRNSVAAPILLFIANPAFVFVAFLFILILITLFKVTPIRKKETQVQ
jgi:hypothetical protein